MLESLCLDRRQIRNIGHATPNVVSIQYRDDLIVGLTTVDHLDTTDHSRIQNNVGTINQPLGVDTDIEWIAIGHGGLVTALGDFFSAVGLRYKPIKCRRCRRCSLRTVNH